MLSFWQILVFASDGLGLFLEALTALWKSNSTFLNRVVLTSPTDGMALTKMQRCEKRLSERGVCPPRCSSRDESKDRHLGSPYHRRSYHLAHNDSQDAGAEQR